MSIKEYSLIPFYNLLDTILLRHQMLGVESFKSLESYISGYKMALDTRGLKDEDLEHFNGFGLFVKEKLNGGSSDGWSNMIYNAAKSEEASFKLFKDLYYEYAKR